MQSEANITETVLSVEPIVTEAPIVAKPKRERKPVAPKAATSPKPKAGKPVTSAADDAATSELIERMRSAAKAYAGASPVIHSKRASPLDAYLTNVDAPRQRVGPNGPKPRDEAQLIVALSIADKSGRFDPTAGTGLDVGAVGRCASVGFIVRDGQRLQLTKSGLARAANRLKALAA